MKTVYIIAAALAVVGGGYALQKANEPKSYEDCLLKNIPSAQSDMAAKAVAIACREKFPVYISEEEWFGNASN